MLSFIPRPDNRKRTSSWRPAEKAVWKKPFTLSTQEWMSTTGMRYVLNITMNLKERIEFY